MVKKAKTYFGEKYYNIRRAVIILGVFIVVLLMGAFYLGILSARHMKEIISEDFNQQQLVLAKYAANRMENRLDFIKSELSVLNLSPSIQYLEAISWAGRMNGTFSVVKDDGVLEIRLVDYKGKAAYVVDKRGIPHVIQGPFRDKEYFKWACKEKNKNRIYVGEITRESEQHPERLIMILATPTYEESVDETHPVPTGRLSGVLLFTLDVTSLVRKATKDIRSGKTGYAWVIDGNGTFLYHPQRDFIGKDAFKARAMRRSAISFAQINIIQKEKMLKGEEGTGSYISGWHRGIETEMKKLISYAPVYLDLSPHANWAWSVAVVAPISEVEDAIHSVYVRQALIQGTIILVILLGGAYVVSFEGRWSKTLEREVMEKTEDLKKSMDDLKKSEDKYKTLVESAEDLIFSVDEKGKFLSMNRCTVNFFRGRPDDLIGKTMCDLFSQKSAELQMGFIRQVFDTGRNINVKYPVEVGTREYWFTSNFVALKDATGKVFAALGISRDITERKKLEEEQMYNTEKLASLGKLAAGVAHELNNPVAVIIGFSDLLLEKMEPGSKNHEILETIERQALNCKRIVESILGYARYPEAIEYSTDVNVNVEKVISVVENVLVTKKINLEKSLAEDLPKVRGDSGHLQQVVMNFITNAFGAMEGGGVLTVSTKRNLPGNRVEILFKDTGHGIKREFRERIFDAFFTTKKVGEGTGLGLSVSYGIVSKYGGDITFETVAEEEDMERKGTTFIVSLPVAPLGSEQGSE
ncbi:MAG: PAS domain-containing protein [Deltaproteobacteria bacterium]|nr:PAS domain-containing protein [Deltaproteobacteria bacterium]